MDNTHGCMECTVMRHAPGWEWTCTNPRDCQKRRQPKQHPRGKHHDRIRGRGLMSKNTETDQWGRAPTRDSLGLLGQRWDAQHRGDGGVVNPMSMRAAGCRTEKLLEQRRVASSKGGCGNEEGLGKKGDRRVSCRSAKRDCGGLTVCECRQRSNVNRVGVYTNNTMGISRSGVGSSWGRGHESQSTSRNRHF